MAAGVVLLMAQSGRITAKDQRATQAITEAITALGGEKNIDGIRSLILTGTSQLAGNPIRQEVELRILLPDSFLWINTSNIMGNKMVRYNGASKGELLNASFMGAERIPSITADSLDAQLNRFANLLMGALLKSGPIAPLTLSSTAGASNRFSIEKATGLLGEIEFDPQGKYPLLISYKDVVQLPPQMPKNPRKKMTITDLSPGTSVVDAVVRFKDRASIDGVMFPRTIVTESQGDIREFRFGNIQINPNLTLKDFEIPE